MAIGARGSAAQGNPPIRSAPNTITGLVTDTLGTPLANVDVQVAELRRRTRTRNDGTFRFDSVGTGTFTVGVRGIGLIAPTARVKVGADGGYVRFKMVRFATILPSMVTSASAGGLSGIIGDTAYRALSDVTVTAVGVNQTTRTDSAGAFFLPLEAGEYMLRLEREGFARQLIGVTIPATEGRRVAAWMVPTSEEADHYESQALFELNQRLIRERGIATKFFSSEDLNKLGLADFRTVATRYAYGTILGSCLVSIGGTAQTEVLLSTLSSDEVEFAEIYQPWRSAPKPTTSLSGSPTKFKTETSMRPPTRPDCGNLGIIVWLKR